ncbi:MAG: pro-sigmaK processing inhibitor BofA family protein [Oscillospiraceae bacterium]|nr:pro-sigmaK processing inhibitor BofA family protein [Oscillospiraceae bacterium]
MDAFGQAITVIFGLVVLTAASRLFKGPFRWALRMALNTALGFAALVALNLAAAGIAPSGAVPGITLFNVVAVGILGLPGLLLLMIVRYIL